MNSNTPVIGEHHHVVSGGLEDVGPFLQQSLLKLAAVLRNRNMLAETPILNVVEVCYVPVWGSETQHKRPHLLQDAKQPQTPVFLEKRKIPNFIYNGSKKTKQKVSF